MKSSARTKPVFVILISCLVALLAPSLVTGETSNSFFDVNTTSGSISFTPKASYDGVRLTVLGPDGSVASEVFDGGSSPVISSNLLPGSQMDGYFTYELRVLPKPVNFARYETDRDNSVDTDPAPALKQPMVQNGQFLVSHGMIVVPSAVKETRSMTSKGSTKAGSGDITPLDVVHADDVIITGSMCVGFDCLTDGTENFGFDTIKLKENNLRIYFDDTSTTAGFPANDWRIITNDSASGGGNYFSIEDSTNSKTPFKIEAGARTSAIYVSSSGRVGFGTATPVLNHHILSGDTPSIRLDQDTSSGWTAQVWDVAGNESNFFVRDTTGGSKLPFRIRPGAPTNTLMLCADGSVVIGGGCP